eukprot:227425-Rhodomonas_salina.3
MSSAARFAFSKQFPNQRAKFGVLYKSVSFVVPGYPGRNSYPAQFVQSNSAEVPVNVLTDKNRNFWRESELLPNVTENAAPLVIAN